jgi:MFS family permease
MGVFALLLAVASAFLIEEKAAFLSQSVVQHQVKRGKLFLSKDFWLIAFSYLAIAFATSIVMTFLVAYFSLDLSIEYAISASLASVVAFSGIAGSLIFPKLSDRIGRKKSLLLCNLAVAASVFGLFNAGANIIVLYCLAVVYGAFYPAMFPIYAACASEYFGAESSGSVLGLWTLFYGIGATASPTIAGYMSESMGSYSPAFTLSAAIMILSVILLLPITSRPRSK